MNADLHMCADEIDLVIFCYEALFQRPLLLHIRKGFAEIISHFHDVLWQCFVDFLKHQVAKKDERYVYTHILPQQLTCLKLLSRPILKKGCSPFTFILQVSMSK